ncbi:hypothetical protein HO675_07670 [Streptococcus suis]|nr:hypothetical protein [Streptococcus suis]
MNKDELIQNELALTIANLSYERARYKAEAELLTKHVRDLQATVNQQTNAEQTLTNRIQELEAENANLKEHNESLLKRLDDMTVEVSE